MRFLIVFLATIAAMPVAYADEQAEAIAKQSTKCWNVPSAPLKVKEIRVSIELDQRGEVEDVTYLGEKPNHGTDRGAIESLGRAIQRCAPYKGVREGVHEVTFIPADAKGAISIFKD